MKTLLGDIPSRTLNKSWQCVTILAAACIMTSPLTVVATLDPWEEPSWWATQGEWIETQALTPDEKEEDLPSFPRFGGNVAIDGSTIVASTQTANSWDNYFTCPGDDGCDWVYVFNQAPDGSWIQTAKLTPDDPMEQDTFGFSLDVDENSGVIVVGNPGERTQANKIYIYERQGDGSWAQTASFKKMYPDVPSPERTLFGSSVAVSGYSVAATDLAGDLGHTFVFEKIQGNWQETAKIEGGGGPRGAVALEGKFLASLTGYITPYACSPNGVPRVVTEIYERVDGEWVLDSRIDPDLQHGSQTVAGRIALAEGGATLLIGSSSDARVLGVNTELCVQGVGVSAGSTGSAWIYERINGDWIRTADIPNPTPQATYSFGRFVDISGDTAVVGSGDNYLGGTGSGSAFIYKRIEGKWILQAKLRNHGSEEGDFFGWTVGVSGSTVVVGADKNGRTGTAHIFEPLGLLAALPETLLTYKGGFRMKQHPGHPAGRFIAHGRIMAPGREPAQPEYGYWPLVDESSWDIGQDRAVGVEAINRIGAVFP